MPSVLEGLLAVRIYLNPESELGSIAWQMILGAFIYLTRHEILTCHFCTNL